MSTYFTVTKAALFKHQGFIYQITEPGLSTSTAKAVQGPQRGKSFRFRNRVLADKIAHGRKPQPPKNCRTEYHKGYYIAIYKSAGLWYADIAGAYMPHQGLNEGFTSEAMAEVAAKVSVSLSFVLICPEVN